jgi:hypothetical protein
MSTSEDLHPPPPIPIAIADASLPVDGGLSGLGLVMSLAGALFLVMAIGAGAMMVFSLLLASGNLRGAGTMVLIALAVLTTTIMRSWAHRAAGQRLLYDGPGTPRAALRRYVVFSAVQTALIVVALGSQGTPGKILGVLVVGLASWPVALAIALAGARFQALLDQQTIPQGEDKGFEGAAILMVVLGLTGLLFGAVMATGTLTAIGSMMEVAPLLGLGLIAIVAMMVVRSWFHLRAGLRGVREAHCDRAAEAVAGYSNFAVLAGAIICGLLFLMMLGASRGRMAGETVFIGLITVAFLMWALAAWPLLVRRFFVERQFADLLLDSKATHTRARDRGLTTLGWFLFGQAVLSLSMALPALMTGPLDPEDYHRASDPISQLALTFQPGGTSPWWSIGTAALQLVASWQLIRMRPNHQALVTLWGAAAALVAIYIHYPMLTEMTRGAVEGAFGGGAALASNLSFMAVAISLVTPIATLILVNRKQRELPTAVLHK